MNTSSTSYTNLSGSSAPTTTPRYPRLARKLASVRLGVLEYQMVLSALRARPKKRLKEHRRAQRLIARFKKLHQKLQRKQR